MFDVDVVIVVVLDVEVLIVDDVLDVEDVEDVLVVLEVVVVLDVLEVELVLDVVVVEVVLPSIISSSRSTRRLRSEFSAARRNSSVVARPISLERSVDIWASSSVARSTSSDKACDTLSSTACARSTSLARSRAESLINAASDTSRAIAVLFAACNAPVSNDIAVERLSSVEST